MGLGAIGLIAGCGASDEPKDERIYENVRAELMGTATGGRDIVVHHESIPGFMPAMVMTLPLADTSAVRGMQKGDKIAFDLIVSGASVRVDDVRLLPDTTTLHLETQSPPDTTDSAAPK